MATATKKSVQKPPSRERPRPGAIMVQLSPEDRAKLLAVQAAFTEESGMPIAISWTVRLAIRAAWDRLSRLDQARHTQDIREKSTAVQA